MGVCTMVKINKEFVNSVSQNNYKDKIFWDDELKGFGLRIQGKTMGYWVRYNNIYGQRKNFKIANVEKMTPMEARKMAKEIFAEIIQGKDPAGEKQKIKNTMTINELCDLYLKDGTFNKKASTLYVDSGRIEHHIKPLIGNLRVTEITRAHIEKMMLDIIKGDKIRKCLKSKNKRGVTKVVGGKYAASRTVSLFGAILEFAKNRKIVTENVARGIKRPKDKIREVFLTSDEITKFGHILKIAEENLKNDKALNIIKLLLLTGCRKNEIASLKWSYIDVQNQCFRFPDTKTGQQNRIFGKSVLDILSKIDKTESEWVFPATTGSGHFTGVQKIFSEIGKYKNKETNKLILEKDKFCLHALRHTFASMAVELGYTELTIAGLLGHHLSGVTFHYSHNTDKNLINSADVISNRIFNLLYEESLNE